MFLPPFSLKSSSINQSALMQYPLRHIANTVHTRRPLRVSPRHSAQCSQSNRRMISRRRSFSWHSRLSYQPIQPAATQSASEARHPPTATPVHHRFNRGQVPSRSCLFASQHLRLGADTLQEGDPTPTGSIGRGSTFIPGGQMATTFGRSCLAPGPATSPPLDQHVRPEPRLGAGLSEELCGHERKRRSCLRLREAGPRRPGPGPSWCITPRSLRLSGWGSRRGCPATIAASS